MENTGIGVLEKIVWTPITNLGMKINIGDTRKGLASSEMIDTIVFELNTIVVLDFLCRINIVFRIAIFLQSSESLHLVKGIHCKFLQVRKPLYLSSHGTFEFIRCLYDTSLNQNA